MLEHTWRRAEWLIPKQQLITVIAGTFAIRGSRPAGCFESDNNLGTDNPLH